MALEKNDQPIRLPFRLIEPSVGTFVEEEVHLPLNFQDNTVFDLDTIETILNSGVELSAASETGTIDLQFSLSSQSDIVTQAVNDDDIIAYERIDLGKADTASKGYNAILRSRFAFDTKNYANYLGVRKLFIGMKANGMSGPVRMTGHLIGSTEKLKNSDFNAILATALLKQES